MFTGVGTLVNVLAVLLGSSIGLLMGNRFPERTRDLVTQVLGLFTLVIGGTSVAAGLSAAFAEEVGSSARMLIILGALLIGAITGSLARIEDRLDALAGWLREKLARDSEHGRFVEAMVTATLVFCVGPLSILGSLSDGLGRGVEQLIIKSVMDGFASIAFASALGLGVAFSVLPLLIYQGLLTVLGASLGEFLSVGQVDALGAAGGVILIGLGLRLAGIKAIRVGDLLPALVFAPLITWLMGVLR